MKHIAAPSATVICVVGAGPAGCYAVSHLLRQRPDVQVVVIERNVAPYGLVRYGVAPDHPDVRAIEAKFATSLGDSRVRYYGGPEVGDSVSVDELSALFSAVLVTSGAALDVPLEIPGNQLRGVVGSLDLVNAYTGHPQAAASLRKLTDIPPPREVSVLGHGNVALDVARMLLRPAEALRKETDTADAYLGLLASGSWADSLKAVHLIGRRGPVQSAFANRELRELLAIQGVDLYLHPETAVEDSGLDERSKMAMDSQRLQRRMVEQLRQRVSQGRSNAPKALHVHYLSSPLRFLPSSDDPTRLGALELSENHLVWPPEGSGEPTAAATGRTRTLASDLCVSCIRYYAQNLPGMPYDRATGTHICDEYGRTPLSRVYAAGWTMRRPTGLIGSNRADAERAVQTLLSDPLPQVNSPAESLEAVLRGRNVPWIDFAGWQRANLREIALGTEQGRPRVRLDTADAIRAAASLPSV